MPAGAALAARKADRVRISASREGRSKARAPRRGADRAADREARPRASSGVVFDLTEWRLWCVRRSRRVGYALPSLYSGAFMQKENGWDQRVKAFLSERWASRPRALAYYTGLWEGHLSAGLANDHFVSEFTGGTDYVFFQRVWEMLLARHLRACGHNISSSPEGEPDFRLEHNGVVVWIEAVSPQPGPDLTPDYPASGETVPHKEMLLRWTTAFDAKWKKGSAYRLNGVIKPQDAYVIAIDGSQLSKFPLAHGASRTPYIVEATLGVGPLAFMLDNTTNRFLGTTLTVRYSIDNKNKSPVKTERFFSRCCSGVSAVIGFSAPLFPDSTLPMPDPILPIQVSYNPLADVALKPNSFGASAEEWIAELVASDAEGQDWEVRRLSHGA